MFYVIEYSIFNFSLLTLNSPASTNKIPLTASASHTPIQPGTSVGLITAMGRCNKITQRKIITAEKTAASCAVRRINNPVPPAINAVPKICPKIMGGNICGNKTSNKINEHKMLDAADQ